MLSGLIILCGFYLLGDFIATLFQWPVPGSILGMLLLFIALVLRGLVRGLGLGFGLGFGRDLLHAQPATHTPDALHQAAKHLLPYLPLFIVPASVGILNYAAALQTEGWRLLVIIVISLVIGLPVSGWIMQRWIERKETQHD